MTLLRDTWHQEPKVLELKTPEDKLTAIKSKLVDRLVEEFLGLVRTGGGEFWQGGWPGQSPLTVL